MGAPGEQPVYSIGAVAQMLEVPASTLRAWEERYGVIVPHRSGGSQRLYSRNQLELLRFIKRQIDSRMSAADAHRVLSQELASGRLPADGETGNRRDAFIFRQWNRELSVLSPVPLGSCSRTRSSR